MLNALCTASMNVSDIVILAVLAVGIVAGIIAGFAKLLNGTIGGIIAFIAAICLGIFLAGYLAGVSAFVDLQAKISDFFVSKFDVAGYKALRRGTFPERQRQRVDKRIDAVRRLVKTQNRTAYTNRLRQAFQRRTHGQRYPCGVCGKPYRESPLRHYRFRRIDYRA